MHTLHATRPRALTLVECVIAMTILSVSAGAILRATAAAHAHLARADHALRAVTLAENLLEEIIATPDPPTGPARPDWGLDAYHDFAELPGDLRAFDAVLYPKPFQQFTRRVTVAPVEMAVAEMGGLTLDGRLVTVTVADPAGAEWSLERFIPDPNAP